MTRKKSFLGALLLSALAVCAFGVANASALTLHECLPAPASEGTGVKYLFSDCSGEPNPEGTFETAKVPGEPKLEGTLTPTTGGEAHEKELTAGEGAGTHAVLHAILGGIEVQITCTGFSTPEAKATNNAGPPMSVTGTGKSKYTGCKIVASEKAAKKCKVSETLETVTLKQTTEEDKVVYEPVKVGETTPPFITINFENNGAETCPAGIAGPKEVTGVAKAAAASPTALEFTKTSGSTLKLGGNEAFFTAVIHFRTLEGSQNTVALETP